MNKVRSQIFSERPDVEMYTKKSDGSRGPMINTTSVVVDDNGKYVLANTEEGETFFAEDLIIENLFLEVPGLGYLRPGVRVFLNDDPSEYSLQFGWHTNISNQTICGWYLRPEVEVCETDPDDYMSKPRKVLSKDRTLYREMLDKLWEVGIHNEQIIRHDKS